MGTGREQLSHPTEVSTAATGSYVSHPGAGVLAKGADVSRRCIYRARRWAEEGSGWSYIPESGPGGRILQLL